MITRAKRPGEAVFGWLMLALSVFVLYAAHGISGLTGPSTPGAFPMAAAAAMVVASAVTVFRNAALPASGDGLDGFVQQIVPPVLAVFFGLVCLFAVLFDSAGFLIASFVFLFSAIFFLHRRGPLSALTLSLGTLAAIYVVFRLIFQVILPEGVVPERAIIAAVSNLLSGGTR
jgi:hypothetical protein